MENVMLTIRGKTTMDVWKYPLAESHIYLSSKSIISLLVDFRKCPAADELLSRIATRVNLILGEFPPNTNEISSTMYTDAGPWIMMAPDAEDPLGVFAFELFNVEKGANTTLAVKGEQNIDEYAKQVRTNEYVSHKGRRDIAKLCHQDWGKGPDFLKKMATSTLEEFLFNGEWHCTMDLYRADWQEKYKPVFCKLNPRDPECIGPPRKLCHPKIFHNFERQSVATKKWARDRFCKLFSQSSKELQHILEPKHPWAKDCSRLSFDAKTDL